MYYVLCISRPTNEKPVSLVSGKLFYDFAMDVSYTESMS